MKPKIALVVKNKADMEVYLTYLQPFDTDLRIVTSFKELEKLLSSDSYNGIIVDLKTKLSVPREQKAIANDLLEHYPVLQSRILPDAARQIRSTMRRRLHFNVLLSETADFTAEDPERTVTLNVIKEGCFIITTSKWGEHAGVSFIIQELDAKTPIVGEIRWGIAWRRTMRKPGIGVRFEGIHASQHQELEQKCNLH